MILIEEISWSTFHRVMTTVQINFDVKMILDKRDRKSYDSSWVLS